jgi:hypothetical protein
MELKKAAAAAMIVGACGFPAVGFGGGVASAAPAVPAPLDPGHGHGDPWPGPRHDNWNDWDNHGVWWANNRHDWWDDRNGSPPWGWGAPPPAYWNGPPAWGQPAAPVNYWGYNATPVWDDGFHSWGIWLFGIWIPLIGFGVT